MKIILIFCLNVKRLVGIIILKLLSASTKDQICFEGQKSEKRYIYIKIYIEEKFFNNFRDPEPTSG